jgi:RNA polymerase sigma-70 factor (ECF subfamily)
MASEPKSVGFDPVRLIQTHQAGVWRYLRSLGCTAEEADDLTQDTFVTFLQRPFAELSDAATAAYLRKAAFHPFISSRRKAGREIAMEQVETLSQWWTQHAEHDRGEAALEYLRDCLQRLPERARRSLELRYRDEQSRQDIARQLGITEHGVRNLMQRAKQQLRSCVETKMNHGSRT